VGTQRPELIGRPGSMLAAKMHTLLGGGLLRKLVGNTLWQVTDKVLRLIFNLVVGVWITRYLGPERFGLLNYAIAFVALFAFLADVGLQTVLVRDLVRRPAERSELLASALALRLMGTGIAVCLSVVSIWLMRPDAPGIVPVAFVIAVGMWAQAFDIFEYDFQARMTPKPVVAVRVTTLVVFSIVKISLILLGAQLIWFAAATTGELALAALLFYIRARRAAPPFRFSAARTRTMGSLLSASWPLAISALSVIFYMRIDQVMLGQMLGDRPVGIFSAAVRLSESWYFIPMAMLSAVAPALTAAHLQSEDAYRQRLLRVMRVMFWSAVVFAGAITACARPLILALYGSDFSGAATVLSVHAWAGLFVSLGLASGPWFVNAGLFKLRMFYTIAGALANIGINIYMIPRYGAVGCAVATLASYCLAAFLLNAVTTASRPAFFLQVRSIFNF
jgi:polysaccharide transporter, PST family